MGVKKKTTHKNKWILLEAVYVTTASYCEFNCIIYFYSVISYQTIFDFASHDIYKIRYMWSNINVLWIFTDIPQNQSGRSEMKLRKLNTEHHTNKDV